MKPKVVLCFDDIGISNYSTAFPLLKAWGFPASCAVISDAIGQTAWNGYDRMNATQMLEMKRSGCDFINHTKSHQQNVLPTASEAACSTEITVCRDAIVSNGLGNGISEHIFAAPYGEYSTNYRNAAVAAGCLMFRGTVGDDPGLTPVIAESDVLYSPLVQVPTISIVAATNPSWVLGQIDSMIGKGGIAILLLHHIVTPASGGAEWTIANFTSLGDGLYTRRASIDVMNMSQLYLQTRL